MKVTIVGCGLSACVLARMLVDDYENCQVEIIEKRDHIGGNCFDATDENGVLTHVYGPHYFRTDKENQLNWLRRFTDFIEANYEVKSCVGGEMYDFPVNLNTISKLLGKHCEEEDFKAYLEENREKIETVANAEEQCLKNLGPQLYEMFFKGYTEKQWGVKATELGPEITARVPLRFNREQRYVNEQFQMMPKDGYTPMFKNMIDHERINVQLNTDYFEVREQIRADVLIYTGELDAYFDHSLGKLKYRSLKFEKKSFLNTAHAQDYVQINYPNEHDYTRSVEVKHVTGQDTPHTNVVYEYPVDEGEPFYPFLDDHNKELADRYRALAEKETEKGTFFVGRLADYRYYNMNVAMDAAVATYKTKITPYINSKFM